MDAPWTDKQVAELNAWQQRDDRHPFTCGGDRSDGAHRKYAADHNEDMGQLVATPAGWVCPVCDYKQNWAHDFMMEQP